MPYTALALQRPIRIEQLISVHYFEFGPDYVFAGESHNFWELAYVDKGEIVAVAGDTERPLRRGQMIFHAPGEFHSLRAAGQTSPNLVITAFCCEGPTMRFFEGRVLTAGEAERAALAVVVEQAAAAFSTPLDDPFSQHLERRPDAPFGAEQQIALALEGMLLGLIRQGLEDPASTAPGRPGPGSQLRTRDRAELFARTCSYLEANLHRQLTLAEICRDNLVGRSYLQKVFREKTGGGVMEYFGRMRIARARELIREGRHNFTEIAGLLGYTSIHYFSRHFKKATGMTPSEYAGSVKLLSRTGRGERERG